MAACGETSEEDEASQDEGAAVAFMARSEQNRILN